MPDPLTTITASTIATLAFQKFVESGAGELAKKFTETGIKKMDVLRQKIWERLRGKHSQAEAILLEAEAGDKQAIESVSKLLDVEMLDRQFAAEIRAIAHEITLNQVQDNSSMNQTNYGGTNFQTKTGDNNTNFFGGTHNHDQK
jgi:hypothetical protein